MAIGRVKGKERRNDFEIFVKIFRLKNHMTQAEMSRNLGCNQSVLSNLEKMKAYDPLLVNKIFGFMGATEEEEEYYSSLLDSIKKYSRRILLSSYPVDISELIIMLVDNHVNLNKARLDKIKKLLQTC
jgi:transcriptional regulator with XRE-family HTH domain